MIPDERLELIFTCCHPAQEYKPGQAEVAGLLALMLLHDSRRDTRTDDNGDLVTLEFQPRRRWDQTKIEKGTHLLKSALMQQPLGPYQWQAAVSAPHAEAGNWHDTDWSQIVALYELLHTMQPSPVVRVNQARSISYASSPRQALDYLQELSQDLTLANYQPFCWRTPIFDCAPVTPLRQSSTCRAPYD